MWSKGADWNIMMRSHYDTAHTTFQLNATYHNLFMQSCAYLLSVCCNEISFLNLIEQQCVRRYIGQVTCDCIAAALKKLTINTISCVAHEYASEKYISATKSRKKRIDAVIRNVQNNQHSDDFMMRCDLWWFLNVYSNSPQVLISTPTKTK